MIPNAHIGVDVDVKQIRAENDAVVICTGATWPRDLRIPNRNVDGIHFAMEYLQVSSVPMLAVRNNLRYSSTRNHFWILAFKIVHILTPKEKMSLLSEAVTPAMTVSELPCVMVRSLLPTLNYSPVLLSLEEGTIRGHSGQGKCYLILPLLPYVS